MIEVIGNYCRKFREETLNLNLTDFSKLTKSNLKNIHAFEKGRANNIRYLYLYYDVATDEQKELFARGLFEVI